MDEAKDVFTVRLSEKHVDWLNHIARHHGFVTVREEGTTPNRSEAIRWLIDMNKRAWKVREADKEEV